MTIEEIEEIVENAIYPEPRFINPLNKGKFRNTLCICNSGKKTKKCHGRDKIINKDQLDEIVKIHKEFIRELKND